jgi:hypothetical protein
MNMLGVDFRNSTAKLPQAESEQQGVQLEQYLPRHRRMQSADPVKEQ